MTFGEKMLELMDRREISLRKLAARIHYDPGYLSKVSRDLKPASEQLAVLLDQELDANGRLVALAPHNAPADHGKKNQNKKESPGSSAGTVDRVPTPDRGGDDMKRRAALQLLSALGAGIAIPPGTVETVLSGVERALGGDHLDLAEWERAVHDYDHRLRTSPAGSLVEELTADIIAMDALFQRHLPPLQRAGLLRVSAALSGLLAIEFGDAGDQRAARVAWGTATRAADASGDQNLRVWVRGRAAEDAVFTRRSPQVAAELADEAVRVAAGTPSAGLTCAYAARTFLTALQGDGEGLSTALTDLGRTFERLPDTATHESAFEYRETQLRWAESFAYVHSGDERAAAALSAARALYPHDSSAPRANLALMEAMSQVKAREISTGVQQALDTLRNHTRSSSGGRLLSASILSALPDKARSLPEARELRALTAGAALS